MKSKKELDEIKEEVEKLDTKLHELTEEELEQVTGGNKTDVVGSAALYNIIARPIGVVDLSHPGGGNQ